jgi:DNA polymerase II small subunit
MASETYDSARISKEFANWRLGITPAAADTIADAATPGPLIEAIAEGIDEDVTTVKQDHVERAIERHSTTDDAHSTEDPQNEPSTATEHAPSSPPATESSSGRQYVEGGPQISGDTPAERWPTAWDRTLFDDPPVCRFERETDSRSVETTGDITGESRTTGEFEDFQRLFRDRHERLREILEGRMPKTTPIRALNKGMARGDRETAILGLVNEVRKTRNGHDLIEIEDTTGTFPVLFSKNYTPEPVKDQLERVITDEVIGFAGSLADDAGILFGDDIFFPDAPPMRVPNTADRPVKAALLSDLHVGAVDFAAEEWRAFVEWMHSEEATDVEYVLIAGDLVEGTGVYPDQQKELDVVDIYDQYQLCAEALAQLPADVDIYTIMGNHDTVRLAEPQPVLRDEFTEPFNDNVHFAGNPTTFTIEGVSFMLYHGMSLNPLTDRTPGLDIHEPTDAMQMMLQKRHLAPMYGMNVRLAPENRDYLLIDDIPDVLHTGHVHTFGVDTYKNVLMANTGCWQYQTDFQKKLNVEPDVGIAPIVNLQTLNVDTKRFSVDE